MSLNVGGYANSSKLKTFDAIELQCATKPSKRHPSSHPRTAAKKFSSKDQLFMFWRLPFLKRNAGRPLGHSSNSKAFPLPLHPCPVKVPPAIQFELGLVDIVAEERLILAPVLIPIGSLPAGAVGISAIPGPLM
ncbi:hypothetical protein K435DRAFT_852539 [Dendrothele bispora CBS 962.96]|uniref:Uncharacterized protein n=1 Tax=Dendrothele bispora (strain CBS 962.96) TaxID=1314807 RepID=A0A4S8MJ95_DENBC|nr:hypothetical protein K435DRAFT_852539 [Dendrothele bispora CBS 962.96]